MLNGLRIVITGAVPGMSRTEATRRVHDENGVADDRVTRKTDLVVCAENPFQSRTMSIKLQTAVANGVSVIPWEEFANVMEGIRPLQESLDLARERSASLAQNFGIPVKTKEKKPSRTARAAQQRRAKRAAAVVAQLDTLASATHARSRIGF